MAAPAEHDEDRAELRDVLLRSLIVNLVGLAVNVGMLLAISKRDWIGRQVIRYRWYLRQEWRTARERAMIAELRRDISEIEHGTQADYQGEGGGLYGL